MSLSSSYTSSSSLLPVNSYSDLRSNHPFSADNFYSHLQSCFLHFCCQSLVFTPRFFYDIVHSDVNPYHLPPSYHLVPYLYPSLLPIPAIYKLHSVIFPSALSPHHLLQDEDRDSPVAFTINFGGEEGNEEEKNRKLERC